MATDDELRAKATALHSRIDLKRFFHQECGLSLAEAADKVRELVNATDPPSDSGDLLTRAGLARAFRDHRERESKRLNEIWVNTSLAARDKVWKGKADCGIDELAERMRLELTAELDACKTDDDTEAVLVRAGWPEGDIVGYMKYFGAEASRV